MANRKLPQIHTGRLETQGKRTVRMRLNRDDLPSAHPSLTLFAGSGHRNGTVWLRVRVGSKENSVFSSRQNLTISKMDMVEEVYNVDVCIHLKERPWLQHGMTGWTACL
jgi:hypothetical protein